jgi:ubiquitin C-terminal hydrolase
MNCGNVKRDAKKRFSIEKSPMILVIHLKRFDNMGRKIKDAVQFPHNFSIKNFKSESIDKNVVNKDSSEPTVNWKEQY